MLLLNTFNEGFTKKYDILTEARMTAEEKILKRRILMKLKELEKDDIAQCIDSANVKLTSNSNTRGYFSDANNSFIFNRDLSLALIIDDLVKSFPKTSKVSKADANNTEDVLQEAEQLAEDSLNENSLEDKPVKQWSRSDWQKYANTVL